MVAVLAAATWQVGQTTATDEVMQVDAIGVEVSSGAVIVLGGAGVGVAREDESVTLRYASIESLAMPARRGQRDCASGTVPAAS